jgi:hypothetical protein
MCKQMSKRDANTLLQLFLVHVDVATTNSKLKMKRSLHTHKLVIAD